jgi:hypothetical protein
MQEQNFKNHGRMVPLFHYVAFGCAGYAFVSSVIYFVKTLLNESGRLHALNGVALCTAVVLALWFARTFALKAQDRAIRAEENFRFYLATGKPFDSRLKMSQIIALRFASDAEFVELANRAVAENLSNKEIKMAIKHWKADYNRA